MNMLAHVFSVLGMSSTVVRHEDYEPDAFADADLVVVGPGPGDPREHDHPKIAAYARAVDDLLANGTPFLAVCLGHQVLCDRLGIPLAYKDIVFQGTQSTVSIGGREEKVGFYNTFVGRVPTSSTSEVRIPGGGLGRGGPGDRGHPPRRRTDVPGRAVPRRVDPHRERLRAAARAAAGAPRVKPSGPGGRPLRLLHLEPGAPRRRRDRRAARRGRARHRGTDRPRAGVHPRGALAGPGPPRRPTRLRPRRGGVRARPARARGLPGHAGAGHGVRRTGRADRARARRGGARRARRRRVSWPASRRRSRRSATTRSPRSRCPSPSR